MTYMVEFKGVTKSFGDLVVLDDLDFAARPNEKVVIIGPSGSGKSTLLRILMTLEKINSGKVFVDGQPLWHMKRGEKHVPASTRHLWEMRKKIGMVFQLFNLFPHMTVLRNVTEAPVHVLNTVRYLKQLVWQR